MRHPAELGAHEVNQFLTELAESGRLSASSQTQGQAAGSLARGLDARGGPGGAGSVEGRRAPGGAPAVWWGATPFGGVTPSGEGHRFSDGADHGEASQGREGQGDGLARSGGSGAQASPGAGPQAPCARPLGWWWSGTAAICVRSEVTRRRQGLAMAVCLSGDAQVSRREIGRVGPASPARVGHPAGDERGCEGERDHQAGDVPHPLPFLRNPSAARWIRHPDRAGVVGPS